MNDSDQKIFERHKKLVEEVAAAIIDRPRQRGKFHSVTADCDPWFVVCELAKHMGPPTMLRRDCESRSSYQFSCRFAWEPDFAIQVLPLRRMSQGWLFCFG